MDYTITAPVVLQFSNAGFEEEPIRAHVTAQTIEDAIHAFQTHAYEILVETDNCDAVDFYPYSECSEKYDIEQTDSPSQ